VPCRGFEVGLVVISERSAERIKKSGLRFGNLGGINLWTTLNDPADASFLSLDDGT